MNCAANAIVRPAAANVGHCRVDIGVARMWILLEERGRGHDLSRLTITALRDLLGDPRLLYRIRGVSRQTLDRVNPFTGGSGHRKDARALRDAVDMHRAASALADAASKLRSRQAEQVAHHPQKRHFVGHVQLVLDPIDADRNHIFSYSHRRLAAS